MILVDGPNAVFGVNTIESPMICQFPGTLGVSVGIGDRPLGGAEKVTRTGRLPFASALPDAGVTDITRNGPGRVTAVGADEPPPPLVSRYTAPPATSATTAVTAAITRVFFDRTRLRSNGKTTPAEPPGRSGATVCPAGASPAPPPMPRSAGTSPALLPIRLKEAPRAATLLPTRPPLDTFLYSPSDN